MSDSQQIYPSAKTTVARQIDAKFKREKLALDKQAAQVHRNYNRKIRQISNMQRGVMKLMGNNPYPNCNREHILFEDNLPGFCYRRNGEPKIPPTILDLKFKKKIVIDMNGKEGLFQTPPEDVIGDSPMMGEILSKPEIIGLLNELRNTSIILSDKAEFRKFAGNLKNHASSELPFKESPEDYIHSYRISLIQHFLRTLKSIVDDVVNKHTKSSLSVVQKKETTPNTPTASKQKMTQEKWIHRPSDEGPPPQTQAMRKLGAEAEARERANALALEVQMANSNDNFSTESLIAESGKYENVLKAYSGIPTLYTNREIGFEKYRHPPNDEVPQIPVVAVAPKLSTEQLAVTKRKVSFPGTNASIKKQNKEAFFGYVQGLINEVQGVCEMEKTVKSFKGKNPKVNERMAEPLIRLLGKESLFKTLDAEDFLFLDYEGGKKTLEKRMAKKLNLSNKPRPGGFTYLVPSPSELEEKADVEIEKRMNETWGKVLGSTSGSRPSTENTTTHSQTNVTNTVCQVCYKKSMNRVCCPACTAKIRLQCEGAQIRNKSNFKSNNVSTWKYSGPPKKEKSASTIFASKPIKTQHFLKSVPKSTHQNYSHKLIKLQDLSMKTLDSLKSLKAREVVDENEVKRILARKADIESGQPMTSNPKKDSDVTDPKSIITDSNSKTKVIFLSKESQPQPQPLSSIIHYTDIDNRAPVKPWSLMVSKMDIVKLEHELVDHLSSNKRQSRHQKFFDVQSPV